MESLFDKDPPRPPPPSNRERIEPEIAHLKKRSSVRHGPGARNKTMSIFTMAVICVLLGLYIMDPVLYAIDKGEAIRVYLYLHNYGAGPQAGELVATRMFSESEIAALNRRQGSFQDYFATPDQANRKAEAIVRYLQGVRDLHASNYQRLDTLGKVRYFLFIRTGIPLPTDWSSLTPTVEN